MLTDILYFALWNIIPFLILKFNYYFRFFKKNALPETIIIANPTRLYTQVYGSIRVAGKIPWIGNVTRWTFETGWAAFRCFSVNPCFEAFDAFADECGDDWAAIFCIAFAALAAWGISCSSVRTCCGFKWRLPFWSTIGCETCRTARLVVCFCGNSATRSFRFERDLALIFALAALTDFAFADSVFVLADLTALAFACSVFALAFLCDFDSAGLIFLEIFGNFFEEWSIFAGIFIVDEEWFKLIETEFSFTGPGSGTGTTIMILSREWCPFPFTEDELAHLLDFEIDDEDFRLLDQLNSDELIIEECLSIEELLTFDSLRFELCDEPTDEDVLELFEAGNFFKLDELAVNDDELDFTRLLDDKLNFEDELLTVNELLLRLLDFSGHQPG